MFKEIVVFWILKKEYGFSFHVFSAVLWSVIWLETMSITEIISLESALRWLMSFASSPTVVLFSAEISLTATVRAERDFDKCAVVHTVCFYHKLSFCSQTCALCSVFQQWWIIFLLTCIIAYLTYCIHNTQLYTFSALCFHICGFSVT